MCSNNIWFRMAWKATLAGVLIGLIVPRWPLCALIAVIAGWLITKYELSKE